MPTGAFPAPLASGCLMTIGKDRVARSAKYASEYMTNGTIDESSLTERRADIERTIARYPHISEQELQDVLRYLRREASSFDQAMVASNASIEPQYRQLCRDHKLDRLGPWEIGIVILVVVGLFAALLFAAVFMDAGT